MGSCRQSYATVCCLCCCGGLPILALLKAAIVAPFSIVIMAMGCTVGALLMLPRDVLLTYRAAWGTGLIGPNLKVLVMLLLPIALGLWPCFVLVVSAIVALVWPIGVALGATFSDDENLLLGGWLLLSSQRGRRSVDRGGVTLFPTIRDALRFTRDFWDFNYHSIFAYIEDVRRARRDGGPFDISFIALILGACQAVVCSAALLVVGAAIALAKLVPLTLGCYYRGVVEMAKHLGRTACGLQSVETFFGTWVVGLTGALLAAGLIPCLAALALALTPILCGIAGIHCAVAAYRHDALKIGFLQMLNHCHTADAATTGALDVVWCADSRRSGPSCDTSCFPKFDLERQRNAPPQYFNHARAPEAPPAEAPAAEASAAAEGGGSVPASLRAGVVSMGEVWDSFFRQSTLLVADGLARGVVTSGAVHALEPALVLGVPACVLLHTAKRSAAAPEGALRMADGQVVTEANRPRNSATELLYQPLLALTRSLRTAALREADFARLSDAALTQDAPLAAFDSEPPPHALLAQANSLAIHISRLPMFRRRFRDALDAAMHLDHAGDAPAGASLV